jgi:uncharacterized membrane protein YgcG
VPPGDSLSDVQRARLAQAVATAEQSTGLHFLLHVGRLDNGRDGAESLLAQSGATAPDTVLVAVDTAARGLEIVTGTRATSQVSDRTCALASLAMTSSFAAGDLVGGLVNGLQILGDHGRRQHVRHLERA